MAGEQCNSFWTSYKVRQRKAVLWINEQRTGQKIDVEDIETARLDKDVPGYGHWAILTDDPVFQEAIMNPTVLAMAKYLCDNSAYSFHDGNLHQRTTWPTWWRRDAIPGPDWHTNWSRTIEGDRVVSHISYSCLMMRPIEDYSNIAEQMERVLRFHYHTGMS